MKIKPQILLVDDELACLQITSIYIESTGCGVVTANGGISALEYLKAHPKDIDLILLDLMMPDMYGLNVLETIKADPELRHIPVIMQSGLLDLQEIERSKQLGATGHVQKPYNRDTICSTIQQLLESKDSVATR